MQSESAHEGACRPPSWVFLTGCLPSSKASLICPLTSLLILYTDTFSSKWIKGMLRYHLCILLNIWAWVFYFKMICFLMRIKYVWGYHKYSTSLKSVLKSPLFSETLDTVLKCAAESGKQKMGSIHFYLRIKLFKRP